MLTRRALRTAPLPPLALLLAACPDDPPANPSTETSITTVSISATDSGTSESSGPGTDSTPPLTTGPDCQSGEQRCFGPLLQRCQSGAWVEEACPDGQECDAATDACRDCSCDVPDVCVDTQTIETCGCFKPQVKACPFDHACDLDENACKEVLCLPGESFCKGETGYQECNAYGTALGEVVPCNSDELCDADIGACRPACMVVEKRQSSLGCEFYAVDMPNVPPRDSYVYALALSNPSASQSVNISIFDANGGAEKKLLAGVIPPRKVQTFLLSGKSNGQMGFYPGDAGFLGTGIAKGRAFRVSSDLPIVATQFNPLGGALAFSVDASLLLPTHALGTKYYHLAWDKGLGVGSSLVIVATADQTSLVITPTVDLPAGLNGLPALKAGVDTQLVLKRYDYIQLTSSLGDLTGTRIVSDKPVAVFGGHSCGHVPTSGVDGCDHIEEQIFPTDTWGNEYVATRAPQRGDEAMTWRVLARDDDTKITFKPVPEGLQTQETLAAGTFLQFSAQENFTINSSAPILVAGYTHGCTDTGLASCPGDPAMTLMVPVEQWLNDYVFLVDSSFTNDNTVLVRKTTNENVEIGCFGPVPPADWTAIPNTGFETAVVNINPGDGNCAPGTNTASSSSGSFGIIVIGEAGGVSYAYPGGMALKEIAPG